MGEKEKEYFRVQEYVNEFGEFHLHIDFHLLSSQSRKFDLKIVCAPQVALTAQSQESTKAVLSPR